MKKYLYNNQELNVFAQADVVVLGGGPAGFGAAISASKRGLRTILIEQKEIVGGMATTGMMSHFAGSAQSKILDELLRRQAEFENRKDLPKKVINPEVLKLMMINMLKEAGVEVVYNTLAAEAICSNGEIQGVVITSKSGREVVLGKIFIDSTGDGDVAVSAGAKYIKGRESDGKMQPATLMFKVGGVDDERAVFLSSFESTYQTEKGELQALAREKMQHPLGHVLLYKTSLPGVVTCNMTNVIGIDGTSIKDISYAESICRQQMFIIQDFLREYVPGYEKCFVISSGSLLGVRETRHIIGEDTITEEDIYKARIFDDWLVKDAYFNFDIHNLTGAGLDETGVQEKFTQRHGYTIPYGCFIPKGLTNMYVAGRSISGTHVAHSNFRVMPICMAMGEGVGTAAYVAIFNNIPIRQVDIKRVQQLLEE